MCDSASHRFFSWLNHPGTRNMFRDFTFIYSDIVVRIVSGSNDAIFFLDMNSVKKFIGRGIPQFTIMLENNEFAYGHIPSGWSYVKFEYKLN